MAIHDATNKPSVISISWGGPESTWTPQAMTAFDTAAQDAAVLGVTICAAAGDGGSSDGATDGANHVDFPASSPNILACGGTSLQSANGTISSETVWNDGSQGGATGGGFSVQFPLPSWQSKDGVKPPSGGGRGVPDVSGDADPQTGYQVLVDGQSLVFGGTSAVAPLWSGLIALMNQKLGKPLGFLPARPLWAIQFQQSVPRYYARLERLVLRGARLGRLHGAGFALGLQSPDGSQQQCADKRFDRFVTLRASAAHCVWPHIHDLARYIKMGRSWAPAIPRSMAAFPSLGERPRLHVSPFLAPFCICMHLR